MIVNAFYIWRWFTTSTIRMCPIFGYQVLYGICRFIHLQHFTYLQITEIRDDQCISDFLFSGCFSPASLTKPTFKSPMSPSAEFGNAFNRNSSSMASTMLKKETKFDLSSPAKHTKRISNHRSVYTSEYLAKCLHSFRYPFQFPSRKVGVATKPPQRHLDPETYFCTSSHGSRDGLGGDLREIPCTSGRFCLSIWGLSWWVVSCYFAAKKPPTQSSRSLAADDGLAAVEERKVGAWWCFFQSLL